jgi:hypothetical protein
MGYTRWIDSRRAVNMFTLGLDCMVTGSASQRRSSVKERVAI